MIHRTVLQQTQSLLARTRRMTWSDAAVILSLLGALYGVLQLGREWTGEMRPSVAINLSPWALPKYTLFSLSRGLIAYVFSLGFTLCYGYWAAKDRAAERVLMPMLDILQSIPVLGFMPGVVLALIALFPNSNVGLELAAVIMIFTGQAWNMTFSFYHSLRSIPQDMREVGEVYRFGWWQRMKWIELPYATIGLVWNSMMSMAGGWFFLMVSEAFQLGDKDFRLPGIGSYMSVAVEKGNWSAMISAVIAMTLMIVALDQILWRPVVVWAQRFRIEESAGQPDETSWLLDWLRGSRAIRAVFRVLRRALGKQFAHVTRRRARREANLHERPWAHYVSVGLFTVLMCGLAYLAIRLILLMWTLSLHEWSGLAGAGLLTLGRVMAAVVAGTIWAVPAGIAIGLSPRLSRMLQPIVQIVASFPAPMLYPIAITVMAALGIPFGWGSIVLMLLGTQWYILFNVIAGATAVPADLREAAFAYRLPLWSRFTKLYVPAVFPYLVTGWVTAAGGAWNASIVAEYITFQGKTLQTWGLGAQISEAASRAQFPKLAASIVVMSAIVVLFNRNVWKRCYSLAERRYSLAK